MRHLPPNLQKAATPPEPMAFAQIGFDHSAVGQAMARHLLDAGHRRVAYLDSGVDTDFRAHERGAAFAVEAQRLGATVQMLRAATGDPFDAGRQAFDDLGLGGQGRSSAPGAIACANDHLACGVLMQALDAGLQVPRDLAVLGFGDFPVGRQLRPALSTVRPPSQAIGRATAQALARALASGESPEGCALPWQLIARGSTSPPG